MSQAPSVAFATTDDRLVGSAASGSGTEPAVARVPSRDAEDGDADAGDLERYRHCVSLKGTTRGLEILISGTPPTAALGARLTELLAEAPSFFAGCDARVAIDGALPGGALACLEEVAARFDLRIVEISPIVARRRRVEIPRVLRPENICPVSLADGTGPFADDVAATIPLDPGSPDAAAMVVPKAVATVPGAHAVNAVATNAAAIAPTAAVATNAVATNAAAIAPTAAGPTAVAPTAVMPDAVAGAGAVTEAVAASSPSLVIGPLRSGTIVEHPGHLIVIGDVNPGAEVRAEGSIIVLGRMRGVAHAGIGCDGGFIVALSLQPQQLRIGRMVARAGDADRPGDGAEIAYATGETIVVERFLGRLPRGLAASM